MHCWRHKTPVIYRATAQWFVGMDVPVAGGETLRERALKAKDDRNTKRQVARDDELSQPSRTRRRR